MEWSWDYWIHHKPQRFCEKKSKGKVTQFAIIQSPIHISVTYIPDRILWDPVHFFVIQLSSSLFILVSLTFYGQQNIWYMCLSLHSTMFFWFGVVGYERGRGYYSHYIPSHHRFKSFYSMKSYDMPMKSLYIHHINPLNIIKPYFFNKNPMICPLNIIEPSIHPIKTHFFWCWPSPGGQPGDWYSRHLGSSSGGARTMERNLGFPHWKAMKLAVESPFS